MRKSLAVAAALLIVAAGIAGALDVGDEPAVSVRQGELRSAPGFLSVITARLDYGESVEVLEVRGDWFRVSVATSGSEGWIHGSALAETEALRLSRAGGGSSGTTSREIALAGRGFNEQVEAEYQSENGLSFDLVDEMETWEYPVDGLVTFLADGGLGVDDGGAK